MKGFLRAFAALRITLGTIFAVLGLFALTGSADRNSAFFTLGITSIVQAVLLLGFVRIIDLLEELNRKLEPVERLATIVASRRSGEPQGSEMNTSGRRSSPTFQDEQSFPQGTTIYDAEGVRIALLPDRSVLVDDEEGGMKFESVTHYRELTKDRSSWTVIAEY